MATAPPQDSAALGREEIAKTQINQGRDLFSDGDMQKAAAAFLKGLDAGGDEQTCRLYLARIYNRARDWTRALDQWRRLNEIDPAEIEPNVQIARAEFRLGNIVAAERSFLGALARFPGNEELMAGLAELRASMGRRPAPVPRAEPAKAAEPANEALTTEQQIAKALKDIDAGNFAEAGTVLQAILGREPANEAALKALVQIRSKIGRGRTPPPAAAAVSPVAAPTATKPSLTPGAPLAPVRAASAPAGAIAVTLEFAGSLIELPLSDRSARNYAKKWVEGADGFDFFFEDGSPPGYLIQYADAPNFLTHAARISSDYQRTRTLNIEVADIVGWLPDHALLVLDFMGPSGEQPLHTVRTRLDISEPNMIVPVPEAASLLRFSIRLTGRGKLSGVKLRVTLPDDWVQRAKTISSAAPLLSGSSNSSEKTAVPEAAELQTFIAAGAANGNWTAVSDLLTARVATLANAVTSAASEARALTDLLDAVRSAEGAFLEERQLFAMQATKIIGDLKDVLSGAEMLVPSALQRAKRLSTVLGGDIGVDAAPADTKSGWWEKLIDGGVAIHKESGLHAALSASWSAVAEKDRVAFLEELASEISTFDLQAASRIYWLSYALAPTPRRARKIADRMFKSGDVSNAIVLAKGGQGREDPNANWELRYTNYLRGENLGIEPGKRAGTTQDIRVAYIASGSLPYQVAGYTIRTQELLSALVADGIAAECFTRPGFPWDRPNLLVDRKDIAPREIIEDVPYAHVPLKAGLYEPDRYLEWLTDTMVAQFESYKPTIVHSASNSRTALPALLAARRLGIPFVYEVRGFWELTAASRFQGWETTERFQLDHALELHIASKADHVFAITRGLIGDLVEGGATAEKVSLLPNAVDPEILAPMPRDPALQARLGLSDADFVLVYAGSLTVYEGLDDLIAAIGLLRGQGVPAKCVIVGKGEMLETLQRQVDTLRLRDAVTFTGSVAPGEVRGFLALADVIALPRKPHKVCEIVTPLKPFEAMSMGKPVVMSNVAALREIATDSKAALLCKPADPADLADVLFRLHQDPALRRSLAVAGRAWIEKERSWKINAQTLKAVYSKLVDGAK